MTRIHLTHRALKDIEDIYEYSKKKWGEYTADKYLLAIQEALSHIESYPEILKRNSLISDHFVTFPVGSHFLVFDNVDDNIFLLTVKHQSRNLLEHLQELVPTLKEEVRLLHTILKQRKE